MARNAPNNTPILFYTVGIVRHSDLFTGEKSRQICVVPCDLVWNRVAVVMGRFFHQNKLAFGTFYNGISFSTLKWKEKDAGRHQLSSVGMSTPVTSSKRMTSSRNAPLPYNTDGI
jgi:hypothetical protein